MCRMSEGKINDNYTRHSYKKQFYVEKNCRGVEKSENEEKYY